MSTSEQKQVLDTNLFWSLYDRYVLGDFRDEELNRKLSELTKNHIREMFQLERLEKGWKTIRAWIALDHCHVRNDEGQSVFFVTLGDVVIINYGWDRDITITHSPIEEFVSGNLLGREQCQGLFLPLFEADTIERAIRLQLKEIEKAALEKFAEEKGYWG